VAARYLSEAGLCALSPDGGQLATAGVRQSFNVNLWSADLRGSAVQLLGHRDNLDALAYAPDGRTLATAGEDGLLKLWHLASRREIARLVTLGQGNYFNEMVFSADGTWLGASDNTGLLHLFHAPPLAVLDAIPVAPSAGR
jgi:WD40 repeat protein